VNATGTITVTARPVAGTLDGNQEICALGSTTFTSTNAGGSWSSSDNTIATIDATTGVIAGIAAGTATITYTMVGTGGCTNATATRTVTVTAIPTTGTLSGTQAICVGGSSTFSSTVTGGSWLSSDNTIATIDATTGVIAGIAAGTATMTYTIIGTGGCADVSATRALTVTAPPTAGLLSGPQDICVLGTTSLTSTVAGGTWTSSSVAIATINTTTGVATGVGAGIATMTYTVAGTGGCANVSATRTVTVTAAPTSGTLSGTQSICVSSSVIFSSSSAGGSWTSSNSLIATINSATGAVSGVAPGTATMTYIVPGTGGCANASATRIVTVTAAPNAGTLTGSQEICVGGTTTLSSSVTGGSWSSSAGTVATINGTSGFVVGMTPGNTTMTYTILGTGGCANAITTRIVTVTATPVAGTLTGAQDICVNGTTTFNSTVTGGTWTSSNGSIATINASTGLITGVTAGTAIMTYTIFGTGGCANATASRIVTVTAPPSAGTLSGVQAICIAGTSLYSSSVVGGNWASSDNTIATINSATGSISGLAAGTVGMTYTVLGIGGCADVSATRTLTVTAPPVAGTLSGTQSICINATTVLSSTIAGGTWTSSDNTIAVVNAASGIVTGIAAGNATMTYTVAGSGGCANVTATRTVTINPNNTVGQASSTPTLCINTPLLPSITHLTTGATDIGLATGLPAGVTASWSNNRITISGAPTVAGTFNYSIPLTGGCGTTAAVGTIIVNPTNTVTVASSSPTLCINTPLIPITLTTTGATDIGVPVGLPAGVVATWLSGVITITGTPTTAGTYNYSIPLVGGCGNLNATGVIIVAPQPVGSISSSTTLLCDGGTVSLTATGGTTYQWYLNGGIIVGATGSSIAANQPGTYTANVISSFGCVTPAAGSITLQLVRKPIVNFTYDNYCAGFPTLFTDQSNVANSNVVTYSWNFGQGQGTSTLQNPTNTYSNPGNYSASLTITPVACPVLATFFTKTVTIIAPPPNQRYSSLNAVENRDLQLNARVFGLAQYSWAPSSGLSSASIVSPIFNYNQQVDYVVTITTPVGCVLKDSILVRIFKEKEIFVPKGFSPNGDGKNDKIFPRLVGVRDLIYFKIFNRWGQLIFQTSVLGEGWDGKVRGVLQPMESYVWIAEGVDIDNNIIKRTGTFLLVR
jgi:gliding motility-associated-like protein